jgi:hypothetical protein
MLIALSWEPFNLKWCSDRVVVNLVLNSLAFVTNGSAIGKIHLSEAVDRDRCR